MDKQSETTGELRLAGPLTIRRAAELKDLLIASLADHQTTTLDVPDEAEADISFVQLLLSARVSARSSGRQIMLKRPAGGALNDVLVRGGFLAGEAAEFWMAGDKGR